MRKKNIGVLAFHGDVVEHIKTTEKAIKNLKLQLSVIPVRTKEEVESCIGLIIPGGESTTLDKLCRRENMYQAMKKLKGIFGTCAGAIMLAKHILHKTPEQQTLELMDITIDRNAYGRQTESFQKNIQTEFGEMSAIFIRAPKIMKVGKNVKILAKDGNEILACEEIVNNTFCISLTFHPELTSTAYHEYFLNRTLSSS